MIPKFEDGVLPAGVHTCTVEELAERFGRFERSDRRPRLTEALKRYKKDVRSFGIADALIIDGSFVTAKAEPNDVDVILILRTDLNPIADVPPAEYNVRSVRIVKRNYGLDVRLVVKDSAAYTRALGFFSLLRLDDPSMPSKRRSKGLLRIEL